MPGVLACTSGTAAANYAPAVHEAREAGVPLLVLTADRPPELREVGAGQVIDQLKLYGAAAKWFFEVGSHEATPDRVAWIRGLACGAVWTALDERPGVVHLNFPLRDPLVPPDDLPEPDPPGREDGRPWIAALRARPEVPVLPIVSTRGVVVAGTGAGPDAASWAATAGWPLFADPLSRARRGEAAIAHYDHLLRGETLKPEVVVRVGDLPTSKPLRAWLHGLRDVEQILVPAAGRWQDPAADVSLVLPGLPGIPPEREPRWLEAWRTADAAAARTIDEILGDELSEPRVARELGAALPIDATLYVASSMPVRDVEAFFPVRGDGPTVLSNRGANGIDGTVSSAFGAAAAGNRVVLLIGDVALAYDIGGLLAAKRLGLPITIVLLNNDGGGIFEFLPVSGEGDAYTEHVATPHGLDFRHAAALYDCEHVLAQSLDDLRRVLAKPVKTTTIVEVRTDREQNRALHARIAEAVLHGG
jgi:2-succinyl-5-enolpyruvyl-6-hydroxy-3-cyclohexene-1-carboxylate synthase